jgi:hypothetical protein
LKHSRCLWKPHQSMAKNHQEVLWPKVSKMPQLQTVDTELILIMVKTHKWKVKWLFGQKIPWNQSQRRKRKVK